MGNPLITPNTIRPDGARAPRWLRPAFRLGAGMALACCLAPAAPAEAFHDGGAGTCGRCHVMHEDAGGGIAMDGTRPLLLAETATDLCLTCHGEVFGRDALDPPAERGAGNFAFLFEDNLNDGVDGLANPIPGAAAGHSIISQDLGSLPDPRWTEAPGGVFPSHQLGCTSCHDPHGNSAFRMLNGVGPVQGGAGVFVNPAPDAVGLDVTDPAAVEAPDLHSAYRAGMSAWCANCHGLYHDETGRDNFEHPVDETLDSDERSTYNRYAGAGGMGDAATAYLPDVALEDPGMTTTTTSGATASSRIMCLSCHRAHGSSAPPAGRWDFRVSILEEDGVVSGSWPIPSPYPGHGQSQLCRKCHNENHGGGESCITCHSAGGLTPLIAD